MSKKLKGKLKSAFLLAVTLSGSIPAMANDVAADNGAEPTTNVVVENKWSNLPDFSQDERVIKMLKSDVFTGFSSAGNHPELLSALMEVNNHANKVRKTNYEVPPIIFTKIIDSVSYSPQSDVLAINPDGVADYSSLKIKGIMAHELGHRADRLENSNIDEITKTARDRVESIMLEFDLNSCGFQEKMKVNRAIRTGLDHDVYESGKKLHPFHAVGAQPSDVQKKLKAKDIGKVCALSVSESFSKQVDLHQDYEYRADKFTVEIGYGEIFKKGLEEPEGYVIDPVFFHTHPTDEERGERMEKQLEQQSAKTKKAIKPII